MESKYIIQIYQAVTKKMGKLKARSYVATATSSILLELEESSEITEEKFEEALKEELDLCLAALKKMQLNPNFYSQKSIFLHHTKKNIL